MPSTARPRVIRCSVAAAWAVTAGIAATGVGDADAEAYAGEPVAGGEVAEHGPRLEIRVDLRGDLRHAHIFWFIDRPGKQCVEMIAYPIRMY